MAEPLTCTLTTGSYCQWEMYSVEMKYILILNIRPYLSEGLLSNAKLAIFQLYQSQNKLNFNNIMMMFALY